MSAAVSTASHQAPSSTPVPFSATLASEWSKLTTLRSTWIVAGLAVGLGIGASALFAFAVGATWDEASFEEQADFDPIIYALIGGFFVAVILPILGVLAVTSEYSTGMIRTTLTATPRRGRVLLAKAAVVSVVTLAASFVAIVGIFLASQAIFGAYDLERVSLLDGDVLRLALLLTLTGPFFPLIGVALATMLRNTAGSITIVLALLFAPGIIDAFPLPDLISDALAYLPAAASDILALAHLEDSDPPYGAGVAAVLVLAWLAAFMGAAYAVLSRRDA